MIQPITQLAEGKKIYFASDFHLGHDAKESSAERERKIIRWLDHIRPTAAHIFLIGVLFDFWYEYKFVVPKGYVRFLGKLAELADAGVPITVFTGNHDLWMFNYFTEELGIPVYRDPQEADFCGKKFLIGHGDGLGPGDTAYKLLKKFIFEIRLFQWLFDRILPPRIGMGFGYWWSGKSKQQKRNQVKVFLGEKEFLWAYCKEKEKLRHRDYYIFGHRHLPLDLEVSAHSRYINTGEWMHGATYAVFDGQEVRLETFEA
jgi:UDP-2,3-diacylglucosamine hydrolase